MQTIELYNGVQVPQLGLGVWQSGNGEALQEALYAAFDTGYRHIDTASFYHNEAGVGQAINNSGIDRSELFITTKVWNADQGYAATLKAFERSLALLNTPYIDLYLVHWPVKSQEKDTWKAMEELYRQGKVRAIGVSNFLQHHLEALLPYCNIKPMVNQLEHHPYLVQKELQAFCRQQDICFEAWSPLMQGGVFAIPLLQDLASKYDKTIAQVVLRWNIQNGIISIPKSIHPERIAGNFDIWNFELTTEDLALIDHLDKGQRVGPDPDSFGNG
ncbi:MAG: aldo/keto reductase [Taibaiella sp.]|nr:aldo/keto reductase [Taibaiella sp.]